MQEIHEKKSLINAYVKEAIELEKKGLKAVFKESTALVYPAEFQAVLHQNSALKTAFDALMPGRKRAYNLFFSAPKQSKTREARIEKSIPKILDGKGLDDD
jgi:uncharacterized protein YdeI (YjbR/CyaY-like superfamily)